MPRFFFHCTNGHVDEIECPDLESARAEGIALAGGLIKDDPGLLARGHDLRIEVTDANRLILFAVAISTFETPATVCGINEQSA